MGLRRTARKVKFYRRTRRAVEGALANARGGWKTTAMGVFVAVLTVFSQMDPASTVKLLEAFGLTAEQALAAGGVIATLVLVFVSKDGEMPPEDEPAGGEE